MAANDNVVTCGSTFTLKELLLAAIGKDASGKSTLRLYESAAVDDSNLVNCAVLGSVEVDEALKSIFTLDDNGDVAIRVSILP